MYIKNRGRINAKLQVDPHELPLFHHLWLTRRAVLHNTTPLKNWLSIQSGSQLWKDLTVWNSGYFTIFDLLKEKKKNCQYLITLELKDGTFLRPSPLISEVTDLFFRCIREQELSWWNDRDFTLNHFLLFGVLNPGMYFLFFFLNVLIKERRREEKRNSKIQHIQTLSNSWFVFSLKHQVTTNLKHQVTTNLKSNGCKNHDKITISVKLKWLFSISAFQKCKHPFFLLEARFYHSALSPRFKTILISSSFFSFIKTIILIPLQQN